MIAIVILGIGIGLAAAIMASSIRNINSSKNRIIAVNLAREGIEAVRNIRDTNWLIFAGRKRDCWNREPHQAGCANAEKIQNGEYIVFKQEPPNEQWILTRIGSHLPNGTGTGSCGIDGSTEFDGTTSYVCNNNVWHDITELYYVDLDTTQNTDDSDETPSTINPNGNDRDLYNHQYIASGYPTPLGETAPQAFLEKSTFKRTIYIEYLQDDGTNGSVDDNRMRIRSVVSWPHNTGSAQPTEQVELITHITDHLGREDITL